MNLGFNIGAVGRTLGLAFMLALALISEVASAAQAQNNWTLNFTPVIVPAEKDYRMGGGVDPEVKYSFNLAGASLSGGLRLAGYRAKNLLGMMAMPTLRLTLPIGIAAPYAAFGMGYGRLPKLQHEDFATMSRFGVFFQFSKKFGIGIEGTYQKIDNSDFRFWSYGSMVSFDL